MADPTGAQGGQIKPVTDDDFTAVARGGDNFLARMKALVDLRDQQEAAYKQLSLGKDATAALKRAQAKLADAEDQNHRAETTLANARTEAKRIVDEANKQAQDTANSALQAKRNTEYEAQEIRKQADDYAKKARGDVDQHIADLNQRTNDARAAERKAVEEAERSRTMAQRAGQAAAAADAKVKEFQGKIDRLRAVIDELK
jgi:hypothetical protein